jgi:hypothetical protein
VGNECQNEELHIAFSTSAEGTGSENVSEKSNSKTKHIGSLQFSSRCGTPLSLPPSLFHSLARSLPSSFTLSLSAHARPCSRTYRIRILLCYAYIIPSCLRTHTLMSEALAVVGLVGGWGGGGVSGLPASERDHGIQTSVGAQKSRW